MKKMIFTAAMMLASAAAMAQSGTFQIKGNVEGAAGFSGSYDWKKDGKHRG